MKSAILYIIKAVHWLVQADLSGESCQIVHRIGGGDAKNLKLQPLEKQMSPPGISILCGGTEFDASKHRKRHSQTQRDYMKKLRRWVVHTLLI